MELSLKEIGKRIEALRESRGWSREELGKAAGTTHVTIGSVETGQSTTNIAILQRIASALGTTAAVLLAPSAPPLSMRDVLGALASSSDEQLRSFVSMIRAEQEISMPVFATVAEVLPRLKGDDLRTWLDAGRAIAGLLPDPSPEELGIDRIDHRNNTTKKKN